MSVVLVQVCVMDVEDTLNAALWRQHSNSCKHKHCKCPSLNFSSYEAFCSGIWPSMFCSDPLHILMCKQFILLSSVYWRKSKNLVFWPFFFPLKIPTWALFVKCTNELNVEFHQCKCKTLFFLFNHTHSPDLPLKIISFFSFFFLYAIIWIWHRTRLCFDDF